MRTINLNERRRHAPGSADRRKHRRVREPAIGEKFGQWTVLGPVRKTVVGTPRRVVPVRCSCGVNAFVTVYALLGGKTSRCRGCSQAAKPWMIGSRLKVKEEK